MIPLVVEIEIVNVRVVQYHGYDLGIEVVQHVVVRAGGGEGIVLAGAPEHGLVGATLGHIYRRVGRLHAPRLFPLDSWHWHVVAGRVRRLSEIDVSSVSRGEFLRDCCDGSVGGIDGVDQRIQLSELVLSAATSCRHRLDHYDIAVGHLDTPRSRDDAVLLRSELRGGILRYVSTRLDVRRGELLLGSRVRSRGSTGRHDRLRSSVSFHCTAVHVDVLHTLEVYSGTKLGLVSLDIAVLTRR